MVEKIGFDLPLETRRGLVERDHPEFPVKTQARLLGLNRSGLYYQPRRPSGRDLDIKRLIDEVYTAHPSFGSRTDPLGRSTRYEYSSAYQYAYPTKVTVEGVTDADGQTLPDVVTETGYYLDTGPESLGERRPMVRDLVHLRQA